MKMMLKNEKNANSAIKVRLGEMDQELHSSNYTVKKLEESRHDRTEPHKVQRRHAHFPEM